MKLAYLLIFMFLLWSCSSSEQVVNQGPHPELIELSSLPALPEEQSPGKKTRLSVYFFVLNDGTVNEVRMINSSGYADWDEEAIRKMRQWRFAEFDNNNSTDGRWVPQNISVVYQKQVNMSLGELISNTKAEADSLYTLLQSGVPYQNLAEELWESGSGSHGSYLGIIGLDRYPENVRANLVDLQENQYTHPIRVGNRYVIYKRFDPDTQWEYANK
ncbi:MAG: TonB family protein [Balneolales bacterium]